MPHFLAHGLKNPAVRAKISGVLQSVGADKYQPYEKKMLIPWIKVAGTIYEVGKVLLAGKELAEQANDLLKTRKRSTNTQEQITARVQELEDALTKQLELHRQYQVQMELLRSALEAMQKSLRWAVIIASLSIVLSIAAVLFAIFK